ncbi:MAG: hypothetical protein QOI92_2115 [Chloroflexota bacterium]|jgi:hypothetical protein|nr:hypothetical protein [Chloroflexota bacterium]
MLRRLIAIAALAFGAIGCSSAAPSSVPTVTAIESPSPAELEAIRFRTDFGLRADLGFVRAVAVNPAASSSEYSVPLLRAEIADLNGRAANADAVREAVKEYTDLHPSDFAGVYIDQKNGGAFTTLWTANLDEHAAAIRRRVRPGARIAFRLVTFTLRDLTALQDRIGHDWDWMRAVGIAPRSVSTDVIANRIDVEVSSANPTAVAIVLAHYAAPAGMLFVESDGTGADLVPWGAIHGRVVDSNGKPPGDRIAYNLNLDWTSDGPGTCGNGDVGIGVTSDGAFEVPCQAGGHTIQIVLLVGASDFRTIASRHVVAIGGTTVALVIKLNQPWSTVGSP